MADYDLGTARGTIEINYQGDGVRRSEADLNRIGPAARSGSQDLNNFANVAGIVVAGGLALAVNSAATFEKSLSEIQAVSGNTAAQMEQIRAKALQLGKDTSFSAQEASLAMGELAKSGLTTTEILGGAADATVALAAAGGLELPRAAEIASAAMNMFSLKAGDMPKVADLMAGAANASAIDVSELGQSLQQVGAVANLAGLSLEDTTIAIAEMGNAGIKGSDAGTSLKSMLSRLQPTTKAAATAMSDLGLIAKDGTNTFYDQEGKLKSLKDIQGLLQDSMTGLTQAQQQTALQTIFGSDAIRAAAVLSKEGADGYEKLATAIGKTSAADVAAIKMDNLKGSFEEFKGSMETAAIMIGTILLPTLKTIVDALTEVMNVFLSLSPGMQQFVLAVLGVIAVALALFVAFVKITTFIRSLQAAWVALNITFSLSPIGLIIILIIALVAAFVILWNKSETFRNFWIGLWDGIKSAALAVAEWFMGTFLPFFVSIWDGIKSGLSAVGGFFTSAWDGIKGIVLAAWAFIVGIVTTYINTVQAVINGALSVLNGIWTAFWNVFGGLIKAVWDLIVAIITLAWALIVLGIKIQIAIVQAIVTAAWNFISSATTAAWNFTKSIIMAVWNFISPYVTGAANAVKTGVTAAWNFISAITSTLWNGVKLYVTAAINAVKAVVLPIVNEVQSRVSAAWTAAKNATVSLWNGISKAVDTAIGTLMGYVTGIRTKVSNAFSGAAGWLLQAGRNIILGLINGVTEKISAFTDKLNSLKQMAVNAKGPPSADLVLLENNGELIMDGLINGIGNRMGTLRSMLGGIGSAIPVEVTAATVGRNSAISSIPQQSSGPSRITNYNTTVNNPLPEPAGESVNERLQTLTLMGA